MAIKNLDSKNNRREFSKQKWGFRTERIQKVNWKLLVSCKPTPETTAGQRET